MSYFNKAFTIFVGLTGDTSEQEARIDMFADTINDVRNPFRAIVMEKDPQKKVQKTKLYTSDWRGRRA